MTLMHPMEQVAPNSTGDLKKIQKFKMKKAHVEYVKVLKIQTCLFNFVPWQIITL